MLRDPEEPRADLRLLVIRDALGRRERADEPFVGQQRAVRECRVHPEQQLRLVRVVRRPRRKRTDAGLEPPAHAGVDALDCADGGDRIRRVGEDQRQHEVEGAPEAFERALAEAAVRGDAGRDQRVGNLQEERASAADEERRFAVDAPRDAVAGEEARARIDRGARDPQPVEVGGRQPGIDRDGHGHDPIPAGRCRSAARGGARQRQLAAESKSGP